jgi:metal-responsive CopG/Arc/MetJ family transcriptional regulator
VNLVKPELEPTKVLLYAAIMAAKPVQISLDRELLQRIDRDPEARSQGRSAFIRSAVEVYLTAKKRRELEERLTNAYSGQGDSMLEEVVELLSGQAWPSE